MRSVTAMGLDLACVLVFVLIGRASHSEGETVSGLARTAWPFLVGSLIGWAAVRGLRWSGVPLRTGVAIWLATVAVGMVLRVVSGQGVAVVFVFVALAFLGLFMLGWRLVAHRRVAA
jgi:Protein of unknown function (DUF3054)